MGHENELEPIAPARQGLSTYELQDPTGQRVTLELPDADQAVQTAAPQEIVHVEARLGRIFRSWPEADPEMALDLAASDMDDSEMLRFAAMRAEVHQADRSWWRRVWDGVAGAGGKVFGAAMNGLAWAQDQTFNRLARTVTNDPTATIGSFTTLLMRAPLDAQARAILTRDEGRKSTAEWVNEQGFLGKMTSFLGDVFIDPLVVLAPIKTARTVARAVGSGATGARAASRAATSADLVRLMRGEVKATDAFKGRASFADLIRKTPSTQEFVRRIDQAETLDDVARVFSPTQEVPAGLVRGLWLAKKQGGEAGVVKFVEDSFEAFAKGDLTSAAFEKRLAAAAQEEALAAAEYARIRQAMATAAKGPPRLFDTADDLAMQVDSAGARLDAARDAHTALVSPLEAVRAITVIPRVSLGSKARDFLNRAIEPDAASPFWQTPGIKQMAGAVGLSARKFRSVARMNPHGTIRVDDVTAFRQVQRLGGLLEDSTGGLRAQLRGTPLWTTRDTSRYVDQFIRASDDLTRREVLERMEKEFFIQKVGLAPEQLDFLRTRYNATANEFVSWVDEGKNITSPIVRSDLMNSIPVLDPFVIKRVARLGGRLTPDDFTAKVVETMNELNTVWKKLAVTRPAWAVAVVGLSEIPRLAIAGLTNVVTHPLTFLAALRVPGAPKLARKGIENVAELAAKRVESKLPARLRDIPWESSGETTVNAVLTDRRALGSFRPRENPRSMGVGASFSYQDVLSSGKAYDQRAYISGWVDKVLNERLRFDEAMREFAQGKGAGEVLEWAKETAAGQRWAREVAQATGGRELVQAVGRSKRMFMQATDNANPLLMARLGRLDSHEVMDLVRQGKVKPPKALPSALWAGSLHRPGMSMSRSTVNRLFGGFFKFIAEDITTVMSREGPYRWQFLSELQRLENLGKGQVDIRKIYDAAIGKSVRLSEPERLFLRGAADNASAKVRQVVYDLAESSRAADSARFIAPFANAFQEEITRWAMLSYARPHIPAVMMNAWREKESAPFSFTDPRSGEEYFYLPFGEQITKFATGKWNPITGADPDVQWGLAVPWKNLNIVTGNGFLPGGGPWLQVGAKFFRNRRDSLGDVARAVDPYNTSIRDILLASPVMREAFRDNNEQDRQFASIFNTVIAEHLWLADGDPAKIDIAKAERQARGLRDLGRITNLLVGRGFRPRLAPQVKEMADYAVWLSRVAPQARERLLVERYGERIAGWMQAQSKSMTGAPPTKEAEGLLLNEDTAPLAKQGGRAFWALFSEQARGDFDPDVYAGQVLRGERERIVGDDFFTAATTIIAWRRYSELRAARDRALARGGFTGSESGARPIQDTYQEALLGLFAAFPQFEGELTSSNAGRRKNDLVALRELAQTPQAQELAAAKGAQQYFAARDAILRAMKQQGLRSLESVAAADLRLAWLGVREGILSRYPDFRLVHARLGLVNDDGLGGQ